MMDKVIILSAMNFNNNSAGSKRIKSYSYALSPKVDEIYLVGLFSVIENNSFQFKKTNGHINIGIERKVERRNIKLLYEFLYSFHKFLKQNSKSKIIIYPSSYFIFDFLLILYLFFRKENFYIELNEVRKFDLHSNKTKFDHIKKLFSYSIYSFMDFIYGLSKGHIYISSTISNYYGKKNSIIIPILCNTKNTPIEYIKDYSITDTFNIGFAGTIDPYKEKMTTFFESINRISVIHPKIRVNLYGRIPDENLFFSLLEDYKIKDFFAYKGIIEQNELINQLRNDNHLLILPRGFTKQNYYGFSTKLSEYLEAQLPILTSTIGDIQKYFIDMKNSITYIPDDVDSLTEKLDFIINNYNSVSPCIVKGGNQLVNEVFHYSNYTEDLYSLLFK